MQQHVTRSKYVRLGLIILIVFISIGNNLVAAKISISTDAEIPRTVINPSQDLYGQFEIRINGDEKYSGPFAVSIFENPMKMTGDYCDRPPYFPDQANLIPGTVGDYEVIPPIDRGIFDRVKNQMISNYSVIKEFFSGNGNYASTGCWEVPWDGDRFMAYVQGAGTYLMNTTYPNEYGIMGLKPGKYTIHLQQLTDNPIFDKDAFAETNVTIKFGDLSIDLLKYSSVIKGTDEKLTEWNIGSDEKIFIKGKNTDSFKSYLWITGPGLPECGTGLQNLDNLPVKSLEPEVLTLPVNPWGDDQNPLAYHKYIEEPVNSRKYTGEWEYLFDINKYGLSPGKYTIYLSSVNPEDVLKEYCRGNISCKPDCLMNTTCFKDLGVCALKNCPTCCAPPVVSATFEVLEPQDITVNPIPDIEICCNEKYPCGSFPDNIKIPVSGKLHLSRLPFQVWVFGDNTIGGRYGYLFNDSFTSYLDNDGSFEIDLYKDLFLPNGICSCDLSPGQYYVIIQTPSQKRTGKELFSVTLEGSKWIDQINNPILPAEQTKNIGQWKYVVESKPVYWTRAFPIEGPEAYVNYDGFYKLKDTLEKYDDQYEILTFNVTDTCNKYVDFSAEPGYGLKPLSVQFTDKSGYTDVIGKLWTFGDGTNSTLQNPVHVYKSPGYYTVNLTLTREGGLVNSSDKYHFIYVKNPDASDNLILKDLTADFMEKSPTSGSPPHTVQFIDISEGSPVGWNWNFGDGSTSTEQSPQHTYRRVGVYNVTLTVFDRYGNDDRKEKPYLIKVDSSSIKASFRYTPDMTNIKRIHFEDLSEGKGINSWVWNFGDGVGSSTEQNPSYQYAEKGCYTVTLKVANNVVSDLRSYRICI